MYQATQTALRGSNPHKSNARSIGAAIAAIRTGMPVIVLDDDDRENEADLVMAAQHVTIPWMTKFIHDCSGIVCLCLDNAIADRLQLPLMVSENTSRHGTPFTISIEARNGVTTGVSAADRVVTVLTAVAENACAEDLVRPGHIFPCARTTRVCVAVADTRRRPCSWPSWPGYVRRRFSVS